MKNNVIFAVVNFFIIEPLPLVRGGSGFLKQKKMKINFDSREYIKGNIKHYKVGIFGSRTLTDSRVEAIIIEKIKEVNATLIITAQEPRGVCEVGQRVCQKYGYPLQVHFKNMQYMRGCFEQRSKEIINEADYFIIIHDGVSQGTINEKKLVEKSGKPFHYEILKPTAKFDRAIGYNIKENWNAVIDNESDSQNDWEL